MKNRVSDSATIDDLELMKNHVSDSATIGYLEFIRLCRVDDPEDFAGFRVTTDGLFVIMPPTGAYLTLDEREAICCGLKPGNELALAFPCTLAFLRDAVGDLGLLGCIDEEALQGPWVPLNETAAPSGTQKHANPLSTTDAGALIRKRSAFIKEISGTWATVETDLSDSGRNGLREDAKHEKHGYWKVEPALNWAVQRGKINKQKAQSYVKSNNESALSPMLRQLLNLD